MSKGPLYFLLHKPYGVLSQFSEEAGHPGLSSILDVQRDVYPVGRLDMDSEGLLILSNDKSLNNKLLNPLNNHKRTYWIEVEGIPTEESLKALSRGIEINLKGKKHHTRPCNVTIIKPKMAERDPPVNRMKHPTTSWLKLELTEGKNRQVRRMTAKIGHPTLRLIRVGIEDLLLGQLEPGGLVMVSKNALYKKLKIAI